MAVCNKNPAEIQIVLPILHFQNMTLSLMLQTATQQMIWPVQRK